MPREMERPPRCPRPPSRCDGRARGASRTPTQMNGAGLTDIRRTHIEGHDAREESDQKSGVGSVRRSPHDALRARVSASDRAGLVGAYRPGADEDLVDAVLTAGNARRWPLCAGVAARQCEVRRTHQGMRAAAAEDRKSVV